MIGCWFWHVMSTRCLVERLETLETIKIATFLPHLLPGQSLIVVKFLGSSSLSLLNASSSDSALLVQNSDMATQSTSPPRWCLREHQKDWRVLGLASLPHRARDFKVVCVASKIYLAAHSFVRHCLRGVGGRRTGERATSQNAQSFTQKRLVSQYLPWWSPKTVYSSPL